MPDAQCRVAIFLTGTVYHWFGWFIEKQDARKRIGLRAGARRFTLKFHHLNQLFHEGDADEPTNNAT
jgi:hypothetical protein